ncbi:MAG: 5-(carboxyamino)imidazole ribonucleotide synthase [Gemmatimonadota bacterium]
MHVGVLGGGQLGRMLALAGYPLGIRLRHLGGPHDTPAAEVAELMVGEYADPAALARFAHGLSVITYEWENVPVAATRLLAEHAPVYPPPAALEVSQDRLNEKTFFQQLGIDTPAFAAVDSAADLHTAVAALGLPAVLKTRRLGYDGKGQVVLRAAGDAAAALEQLGGRDLILEAFVPFDRELSVIAVRSVSGETRCYPLIENQHAEGILRLSLAPAPRCTSELQKTAESYALRVLDRLQYVGVLAIELFERNGELLANEMAPRVHNSGHWTIEGAETSQFENHLRAILDLPLGATRPLGWSAMLNLIGGFPDTRAVLERDGAHLHLYGKTARPGRKLGHVTIRAESPVALNHLVGELRDKLRLSW